MATVRTQAGSERFGQPIGSVLDPAPAPEAAPTEVSPTRLRALRAIIMAKHEAGDEGAVRALTEKFRAALATFSAGKTPEEVEQALEG